MSRDQRIDQSATSYSIFKFKTSVHGPTFFMTSHVRSALWTLLNKAKARLSKNCAAWGFHNINSYISNFFWTYSELWRQYIQPSYNIRKILEEFYVAVIWLMSQLIKLKVVVKFKHYEKATKFETIFHLFWQTSCFDSVLSEQVEDFF